MILSNEFDVVGLGRTFLPHCFQTNLAYQMLNCLTTWFIRLMIFLTPAAMPAHVSSCQPTSNLGLAQLSLRFLAYIQHIILFNSLANIAQGIILNTV
jgi:hypothetical protein